MKIGTIYTVEGHVQIISADNNIGAHKAIVGKSIYSNDVIRTTSNSKCKIIYDDKKTMLIMDSSSELKLSDTKKSRSIHINYGSSYLRNVSKNPKKMVVFSIIGGLLSVFIGLFSSLEFNTPSGPSIIAAALILFIISLFKIKQTIQLKN